MDTTHLKILDTLERCEENTPYEYKVDNWEEV